MSVSISFFTSSIGRKVLMAVSGLALYGFVIAHLVGNLQVFLGQEAFNAYAAFLKSIPGPLWAARIGLLVIFVLHVAIAISLWLTNASARSQSYSTMDTVQASAASLYMLETGLVILLFVIMHLLHFTFGALQPEYYELLDSKGRHDVFSMLVHGFQSPLYSIGYIACIGLLSIHLSHGFSSLFQTLGISSPAMAPRLRKLSKTLAWLIALGYISIPVAVLLGIVTLPTGVM